MSERDLQCVTGVPLVSYCWLCVLQMLSGVPVMQRAACDAYGIIVNVLTSDQHNWCVPHVLAQRYKRMIAPKDIAD